MGANAWDAGWRRSSKSTAREDISPCRNTFLQSVAVRTRALCDFIAVYSYGCLGKKAAPVDKEAEKPAKKPGALETLFT